LFWATKATKCVLQRGATWMNTELSQEMQVMQASQNDAQQ